MEFRQQQGQQQIQKLTPQMLQSIEILQMGAQELANHVEEQLLENPVLELEEAAREQEQQARQRTRERLSSSDYQNRFYYSDEEYDPFRTVGTRDFDDEDFCHFVESQLDEEALGKAVTEACRLLIYSLNDSGWLDTPLEELAEDFHLPLSLLEQAFVVLQGLEPAGVGARSLSECLMLQLRHRGEDDPVTCSIATDHLEALSKNHLNQIAQQLRASKEDVVRAAEVIRSLSPRPSAGFSNRQRLSHVTPDVVVVSFEGYFEILLNDTYLPRLRTNDYYSQLLQDTQDPEVKTYLADKVKDAKQLLNGIKGRSETLLRCARLIVARQEHFFRNGPGHLQPLNLAVIAQEMEVHESTVSRAVKDKFLQCSYGVFPLSYFFSRAIGDGEGLSQDRAKAVLRSIIEGENKQSPLSDQKICDEMAKRGTPISRRTVAKYRDELNILPASQRKKT